MRFQLSHTHTHTHTHTHAYPGCRVRMAEEGVESEELAEFSDGVIVRCRHRRESDAIILTIFPHRTARGTNIDEKTWKLLPETQKGEWKIAARLSG